MLLDNYDKLRITKCPNLAQYYIEIPNGEVVSIWSSYNANEWNFPVAIDYYSADRSEKGLLGNKHKIVGQFVFALVRNLNTRREMNMFEKSFIDEFATWARHWNQQYTKYFHTNEDILSV
jgi:hypothetical protein